MTSDNNSNEPGIRTNTNVNKLARFNVTVPWFKSRKIYFPIERQEDPRIVEAVTELSMVSNEGMRSKHDDFLDTISMLPLMKAFKPSEIFYSKEDDDGLWEIDEDIDEISGLDSYIV